MLPATRQVKERVPHCRNKSQAEGILMARRGAIFDGTYRARRKAEPTTLAHFAERFLDAKRHLRTVKKYRQQLRDHLIPHFRQSHLVLSAPRTVSTTTIIASTPTLLFPP